MATTHRASKRALALAHREIERLEVALRHSTIERLIDVEVQVGIRTEKQRIQSRLEMEDEKKYPSEALEYLRNDLLIALARINHASGGVRDQPQTDVGYIQ